MVVPRSSSQLASDSEFTLYGVTTFKKYSAEFIHKCRERRWTPRDFRYEPGGSQEETREIERLGREERTLWGEILRLGRTGWSDAAMTWVHVLALRVFVETILRYGLPAEYVCGLVKVFLVLFGDQRGERRLTDSDNTQTRQESPRHPRRNLPAPGRQRLQPGQQRPRPT